jgi:hypothetical protein
MPFLYIKVLFYIEQYILNIFFFWEIQSSGLYFFALFISNTDSNTTLEIIIWIFFRDFAYKQHYKGRQSTGSLLGPLYI